MELIDRLRSARRVAVLTGAGVSAESGVPTFRDAQSGLWAQYRPEDLATPQAFQKQPSLVWEWYAWRRELVSQVEPNAGHLALAQMERLIPEFTVVTQNVDRLHKKAGSLNVIELHGDLQQIRCSKEGTIVENWVETGRVPPCCPACGDLLRPNVVWFGESLPEEALRSAWETARKSEIFLSIGTSTIVEPAASLPWFALQNGAIVLEVNPNPTPLSEAAHFTLNGAAGVVLPELVRTVWG